LSDGIRFQGLIAHRRPGIAARLGQGAVRRVLKLATIVEKSDQRMLSLDPLQ
jgi:hypothetical protein